VPGVELPAALRRGPADAERNGQRAGLQQGADFLGLGARGFPDGRVCAAAGLRRQERRRAVAVNLGLAVCRSVRRDMRERAAVMPRKTSTATPAPDDAALWAILESTS